MALLKKLVKRLATSNLFMTLASFFLTTILFGARIGDKKC